MKKQLFQEQGQALILIAFALIGLVAVMSLAIDGSAVLSDRRHAQNAADTAALAAALSKVNGGSQTDWTFAAVQRATDNGYTADLVNTTVSVYNPPNSGIYADCSNVRFDCHDYVQVIITTTVNTYFAHLIGIDQLHNRVEAVARTIGTNSNFNFGGNSVVALSQSGCAVITGGNGTLNVTGGGIFSNSTSGCAYRCNGSTLTANIPSITTVGGDDLNGCTVNTTYAVGSQQISFPPTYEELAEPSQCLNSLIAANDPSIGISGSGSNKTADLPAGHYSYLPLSNQWKNMILNPGVYCIDTTLDVATSLQMKYPSTSGGVLLYFRPSSNTNIVAITGTPDINIWGINSNNDSSLSAYTGYLMYFAPNYSLSSAQTCKFNGSSTSTFNGTIYAPYCNLQIGGNAGMAMQSQLIGYTVDLSGNPNLTLDYTNAPKTVMPIHAQVGLSK